MRVCHYGSSLVTPTHPDVSAIVVAYGAEPCLEPGVRAILASQQVSCEVILVDNGCTDGAVDRLESEAGVTVLRPGENLGFAGGCNLGAAHAAGDLLALVNPDATVWPDALAALAEALTSPDVGIATASVRLADRPDLVNSAGNEIHFSGMSWSGHFEDVATAHGHPRDVAAASGAAMAMRRSLWEELGGFDPDFFAYYEDADLSLRCWQQGKRVVYVPSAVVLHRYEFSRNPEKFFLLERNRTLMVWSCYSRRLLLAAAPGLLLVELATFAMSLAQGWSRQKVAAWGWIWRNRRLAQARRRAVQGMRRADDSTMSHLLSAHLNPANHPPPAWLRPFDLALAGYWLIARRLVRPG